MYIKFELYNKQLKNRLIYSAYHLGKPSLKKKSVTFFTFGSDPPPILRKV